MGEPDAGAKLLPAVGFNMALELTIRASVSFIFRILMGAVAGLPVTAISVNATVAFGLTSLLEVPTGFFADLFGPLRSVRLGCLCQSLAALSMFLAIVCNSFDPTWMWVFLVLEGVFDAFGNTLISGAREAFHQDLARHATEGRGAEGQVFREKLLLLTERFGRYIPTVVVPLASSLAVLVHIVWQKGHFVVLALSVAWLVLGWDFGRLGRLFAPPRAAPTEIPRFSKYMQSFRKTLGSMLRGAPRMRAACVAQALGWFAYILVNSYLSLDLLRNHLNNDRWAPLWMTVFYTGVFAIARFVRSFVLPRLAAKSANERLMIRGGVATLVTAGLGYAAFAADLRPVVQLATIAIFMVAFDSAFGLMSKSATGIVLVGVDAGTQATALSLLNAVTIGLQALYSVGLTGRGVGVPPATEIFAITAAVGLVVSAIGMTLRVEAPHAQA